MSLRTDQSTELSVVDTLETGVSNRDAARLHDVSEGTIRNIIKRYEVLPSGFIDKLCKSSGVTSMRFGLLAFEQLTQRLLKGEKIQAAQLAVMGGIGLQRGREFLEKGEQLAAPDWSKISVDHVLQDPTLVVDKAPEILISEKME